MSRVRIVSVQFITVFFVGIGLVNVMNLIILANNRWGRSILELRLRLGQYSVGRPQAKLNGYMRRMTSNFCTDRLQTENRCYLILISI